MTETIMFNGPGDLSLRLGWRNALLESKRDWPGTTDEWLRDLVETYGIEPIVVDLGMAGMRIVDPNKFTVFVLRWM